MSHSNFVNNSVGFNISQSVKGSLTDSLVSNNSSIGVNVGIGELTMTRCEIAHNGTGVAASFSGIVRMSSNTVYDNTTGLSGATIISLGNNVIEGNGTNGSPTSTIVLH